MKTKYILPTLALLLTITLIGCSNNAEGESGKPDKVTLDYAYYSPTSLVLKEKGWAEEALKEEGIDVEFVLSQGSNKALEFLNSSSVDFSSSAGAAALMAKANGSPVESVYLYSKPEWTALVTNADSNISSVEDLKGKKVAATLGTDPYIFLVRALKEHGMSPDDIELVNLQHADGASALSAGNVDAWAGLDPHMARLELESDAKLFYREPTFNTYGSLNVRSDYAEKHPEVVKTVIEAYEKARKWTIENPEEAAKILAEEANIDLAVAKKEMERNDFSDPIPGEPLKETVKGAGKVLKEVEIIDQDVKIEELTKELVNPSFAKEVIQ
ncbi:aliphatic sulfonate ABC transporter substrate-binding protein [Halobacillus shinanisalinarum]|uniref:Aliphatic sulfonate ABC transporter substrate-binding protein n=1 Tax=Halobacillus shinanisalinarum TaxID=2932258 RepID=A0ABY4GU80_9BACI|nr:aliphatic sulfonate ABC transporter substrate-binding protein [Halobacillus shinanisalinarum]UOQ91703.1 aliphatic sulfonate ABC transporter substrate-binding protein [Halobacillus shinanisalinarum]